MLPWKNFTSLLRDHFLCFTGGIRTFCWVSPCFLAYLLGKVSTLGLNPPTKDKKRRQRDNALIKYNSQAQQQPQTVDPSITGDPWGGSFRAWLFKML